MEVLVIEKEAFQEDLAVLLTLNISSTCWRKLVACAPYGRALSSLLYKHEQNARASGGRKPKTACVASHLHTLITLLKKKNVRGDSPLRIYFYFKIEYIEYIKIFCYLNHTFCLLK